MKFEVRKLIEATGAFNAHGADVEAESVSAAAKVVASRIGDPFPSIDRPFGPSSRAVVVRGWAMSRDSYLIRPRA